MNINAVNSFHNILEKDIVTNRTGVGSNYLSDFVLAYTNLINYRNEKKILSFTRKDAEDLLVKMCKLTLEAKASPTREEIANMNIGDLPRPSVRITKEAQRRMKKARTIIRYDKIDDKDKSAYEAYDTNAQFMFKKRKFFQTIGTIRLNELIKQYGLYEPNLTKRQKIDKMCALDKAQDIIFYEIYLHNYGSITEFENAMNALPQKKKRGRPKKKK